MRRIYISLIALCLTPVGASAQSLMPNRVQVELPRAQAIPLDATSDLTIEMTDPNRRLVLSDASGDAGHEVTSTLESDISSALSGVVEYRWNDGENPTLAIAGIPAAVKFKKSTLIFGLNYEFE